MSKAAQQGYPSLSFCRDADALSAYPARTSCSIAAEGAAQPRETQQPLPLPTNPVWALHRSSYGSARWWEVKKAETPSSQKSLIFAAFRHQRRMLRDSREPE